VSSGRGTLHRRGHLSPIGRRLSRRHVDRQQGERMTTITRIARASFAVEERRFGASVFVFRRQVDIVDDAECVAC
jgi:hypothetical protein